MIRLHDLRRYLSPAPLLEAAAELRPSRAGLLRLGGWLAYGAVVFALVFALKFYLPRTDALVRQALAGQEAVVLEFPHLEPTLFPLGADLDYLRVYDAKTRKPLLLMKQTSVRLSALPLLLGKVRVTLRGHAYGGTLEGTVSTGVFLSTKRLSADLVLDTVDLEQIPQVRDLDAAATGLLSGEVSFSGDPASPWTGDGELSLHAAQLGVNNLVPVVKGPRLEGFRLDVDCRLQDGVLTIGRMDAEGDDVSFKSSGALTVDPADIYNSTLSMSAGFLAPVEKLATSVLQPQAVELLKKKQPVKMKIDGTLRKFETTVQ
ncbi:MAG: type II secretion system protein GspN [Desulfovibrionaceae bacterium]